MAETLWLRMARDAGSPGYATGGIQEIPQAQRLHLASQHDGTWLLLTQVALLDTLGVVLTRRGAEALARTRFQGPLRRLPWTSWNHP